jgi:hypothetical protein
MVCLAVLPVDMQLFVPMRTSSGVMSLIRKPLHCYATFPIKSGFRATWLCVVCTIHISCYVFVFVPWLCCLVAILVVDDSTKEFHIDGQKQQNKPLSE